MDAWNKTYYFSSAVRENSLSAGILHLCDLLFGLPGLIVRLLLIAKQPAPVIAYCNGPTIESNSLDQ